MSLAVVTAASSPAFYARVSYIALKVAQTIAKGRGANHAMRAAYCNRVFRGEDNAVLLAMHVATNPAIAAALAKGGAEAPSDDDIESVLESIWDARANAFGGAP